MEFSFTPMYNSVYIEGINNLYEFDVGELSGWMYKVNNWFPNYVASRYVVKEGDNIEWVYTCNLGADVGGSYSTGGLIQRAGHGITILSIMISWALENAIETADSMKSRGYGLKGRSAFSIYKMTKRDKRALGIISFLGIHILLGSILGAFKWRYFPTIKGIEKISIYSVSIWIAYGILCLLPIIINKEEERQWKATQLKI